MKQATKKLTVVPETGIVDSLSKELKLTIEQEQTLRANAPKWIPEKENIATSMMQTGQEFLVLTEEILAGEFGFSEKEIIRFEEKLKKILPILHEMEVERNLSILSPKDMAIVGDIAEKRYERLDEVDKYFFLDDHKKKLKLKEGKKK